MVSNPLNMARTRCVPGRRSLIKRVVLITVSCYLLIAFIFRKADEHDIMTNNDKPLVLIWHQKMTTSNRQSNNLQKCTSPSCSSFSGTISPFMCDFLLRDLQSNWTSHSCFEFLGVNGTLDSFKHYVHQIFPQCYPDYAGYPFAEPETNLTALLELIKTDQEHINSDSFMKQRIQRMWPQWIDGLNMYKTWIDESLKQKNLAQPMIGEPRFYGRKKLRIHLHMGFLTSPSIGIEEAINTGGPLGELVQWADLIAALFLLGHQITVSKNVKGSVDQLNRWLFDGTPCHIIRSGPDLIYTDIRGFKQLSKLLPSIPHCRYRILDSFGTENKYNVADKRGFGGLRLKLQQFQTFFPHTPDNTFLGFVVEAADLSVEPPITSNPEKPIALVAGKVLKMWQNSTGYLEVLSEFFDIHGNVADAIADQLPGFVTNHNEVHGNAYLALLRSAKVLVGLGFPYESPAPLEAIANGVIFLNVKFTPPHTRSRTKFFADKPTDRELTSQHPYIEQYIGEPYSYLVVPDDANQVRATIRRLLERPTPSGYIPFEFTVTGFLERLNALIEHQQFCGYSDMTAHQTILIPVLAPVGWSCNRACESTRRFDSPVGTLIDNVDSGTGYLHLRYTHARPLTNATVWSRLRCAPEHFPALNDPQSLKAISSSLLCNTIQFSLDLIAPFRNPKTKTCVFQTNELYFSCAYPDQSKSLNPTIEHVQRICPCHNILPGQPTLCEDCL